MKRIFNIILDFITGIFLMVWFFPIPLLFPIAATCTILGDECSAEVKALAISIFYWFSAFSFFYQATTRNEYDSKRRSAKFN
jgi:hypothetical protein